MPRFDDTFLEQLTSRADLAQVVSRYTALQRKGERLWGLCPFHGEKTASFTVQPDKQLYYCFGCGKGGGVIQFVMDMERMDFAEAVEHLANMYNIELPETQSQKVAGYRKRLLEANRLAAHFFVEALSLPTSTVAQAYVRRRALSPKTVRHFGIGYAPDSWNALTNHLRSKGFSDSELVEVGLAKRSERGGIYDTFRHRLMFPIIDVKGNVIGFGGRVLEGDGNGQKYLNTGNTPVFFKKENLYAFPFAKKSDAKKLILVEGYMDVVSLHQAGFDFAVASLGTALTEEQARMIAKTVPEIIIAYDTDKAGIAATERAVRVLSKEEIRIRILRVPGGKDPDEFIRTNGADAFAEVLKKSAEQMAYRIDALKTGRDLKDPEGRIAYIKGAALLLSELRSKIETEVYAGRIADETGITREAILAEVENARKKRFSADRKRQHAEDISPDRTIQPPRNLGVRYDNPSSARAEEALISLLAQKPDLASLAKERIVSEDFTSPELRDLYLALLAAIDSGTVESGFLNTVADEKIRLLYCRIVASDRPHNDPVRELEDLCDTLNARRLLSQQDGQDPLLKLREKKQSGTR